MKIRNDVVVSKNKRSKKKPWTVRHWGKYDVNKEKQPRLSKSFETKRKAEKYRDMLKADIEDGISVEPKKITLSRLCEKYLESRKNAVAPTTLRTYSNSADRLIDFGSQRNVKSISEEEAQDFVNSIELTRHKHLTVPSDSTRAKHLRNSKIIFTKGVDWNYIRTNPFKKISLGKAEKEDWHRITPKEFNVLIKTIDNTPIRQNKKSNITEKQDRFNKTMLKALFIVMYDCGLRFGEAINLHWADGNIDFINNKIYLRNRTSKNGFPPFSLKNYQARTVPCTSRVMEALKELREISNIKNPYVFLSDDRLEVVKANWKKLVEKGREDKWVNSMMTLNTNRKFKTYCDKAGIITMDRLSVHCLRKGFGCNLADLKVPIQTLKKLMGHSNIETTMNYYLKSSDENEKKAIKDLEKLAEE